jgi:hypothetical protein
MLDGYVLLSGHQYLLLISICINMKIQFTENDVKKIIAEHLQDTLIDLKISDIKTCIDGDITYYELEVDIDKLKGEYKCS